MSEQPERYKFITATVDCGTLIWTYKVESSHTYGRMGHDEDVSEWSDDDIIKLTMDMLSVDESQRSLIEVNHT